LPIASRIDVRVPADAAIAGESNRAITEGWIRLRDGTSPTVLALPLFVDAFPPSLFAKLGSVGWVPTIELTVHVRRRPVDGWIQARFECDDLVGGRMIESGTLWDQAGRVVARSRQLGLLLET
jgi:acyl-CoA thioesterase